MSTVTTEPIETQREPLARPDPVLIRAMRLLKRRGWVRRRFNTKQGYCLIGAINEARGVQKASTTNGVTDRIVQKLGFADSEEAWEWNDDTATSRDDVIERLERGAYGL